MLKCDKRVSTEKWAKSMGQQFICEDRKINKLSNVRK